MSIDQNTTNTEPTQAPFVTITRVPRSWGYCPLCEVTANFESTTPEMVLEITFRRPPCMLHFCDAHWAQVLRTLSAATP